MKTFLFSVLFLLPFITNAAKTYTVTITVNQLDGMKPLENVTVQYVGDKDKILFITTTDINGKATFLNCKEKFFDIVCIPSDKNLRYRTSFFFNSDYKDMEEVVGLFYTPEKELDFVANKMKLADLDTTHLSNDTCKINNKAAEFPGGRSAMIAFLQENLGVPAQAEEMGIKGKVYLKFIIDHNGVISNIHVDKGIPDCPDCDAEAIRVIAYMPQWIPASCDGKTIITQFTLPIAYYIQ